MFSNKIEIQNKAITLAHEGRFNDAHKISEYLADFYPTSDIEAALKSEHFIAILDSYCTKYFRTSTKQ